MSGPWQQYPPHPGVYQQPGSYGQATGYPQSGYPQAAPYGTFGGQPQHGPYAHHPPSQAPHPHMNYPGPQYPQPGPYPSVQQHTYAAHPPMPPSTGPAQPSQGQDNCFNCGAPDHWAQNCPEPKRAVPYGQIHQTNRGGKRFKANYRPPIVTKYPVPPQFNQSQQTSPYTTSPGWSQPNQPYPTPSSTASSPSRSSWPGPNPQQHFSQGRSHPHPASEAWPGQVPGPPLRRPSYQTSDILTPPYGSDHGQTQEQPSQNGSQSGDQRKSSLQGESAPMSRRPSNASTDQSVSMESDSDGEDEAEAFHVLDIPDLPDLNCYAGAKQPHLVAAPLPALSDSDELGKLVRPESGSEKIKSRYHNESTSDSLLANFREHVDSEAIQNDPLFLRIRSESPLPIHSPSPKPALSKDLPSPPVMGTPAKKQSPPVPQRASTPVYQGEDTNEAQSKRSFDPFDPSTGDLEHLVQKHYPDSAHGRAANNGPPHPPPPPPPPPPEPYYNSRPYPEPSPSATSARKRSLDGQGSSHRSGSTRQRDASSSKRRRSSQKVVDVHSRRW